MMSDQQSSWNSSNLMKACVTGGTGYMASLLIKCLLQKGYTVNTTARDPDNLEKITHLLELGNLGELKIFRADLTDEGSFQEAVTGCDIVFHIATPVHFASEDPENDMIKPAIQGTLDVLKSCVKAKTVKRVIMTSSAAAVSINKLKGTDLVMNEECWTDVDFLYAEKPPTWGYPVSKTVAEKAAWEFAEENNIDLITVIPSLMAGPSLTPNVPSSICLAMSLLTGNELLINGLKGMQVLSGSISITHVEDVVRAHIFLAEKQSASGRYICCAVNTSVPELAMFLNKQYPQYEVPTNFGDFPASQAKLILSSMKLIEEGFSFKYGVKDIYDESIEYFKNVGLLQK
ncbi:Anthocyanidin reductase ((2S)-flavan-3-ol-forming) [Thalictrum thalictroides]|uniref:Anthocyanidin reductase ((2S)-flavan-3-ol-forming) n=1 Tax=Thalictrum thalictroides TaxID=46969 RepID=A0A7J6WL09_THATH|nr:Anthocyanidin reductase ((2S)-flavan-3-ol-forming) [Thalictrum thalictroides]